MMRPPPFYILDERDVWHQAIADAALEFGFDPQRIKRGSEAVKPGFGFIRPHATPSILIRNHADDLAMRQNCTMIQDRTQVLTYENKTAQWNRWGDWMPPTWRFKDRKMAANFASTCKLPIVSKADVGASSVNVRIISDRAQLMAHIAQAFGPGIKIQHCDSKGTTSSQRGYVLLQKFIPHDTTYRVNIVGGARAIFRRFNYPDRMMAQTGNVAPVMELDPEMESLLDFADTFAAEAGTKWCALDILKDGDQWRLIETSLAWPWPSPGDCNSAPLFRTKYIWIDLFRCMFSEIMKGEFGGLDRVL